MSRRPTSQEPPFAPGDARPDRFAVAAALREIGVLIGLAGTNHFRARAYERGAQALERMDDDLDRLLRVGRLTSIDGIGPALDATVRELVDTGHAAVLDRLRRRFPPGVLELHRVLPLGRIRAVHNSLGITTLPELREACEGGRLRGVRGFGEKTEQRILERIRALETSGDDVLLSEATRQGEDVLTYVRAHPAVTAVELAGDLRRRVEVVDRLELVVASDDPAAIIEHVARGSALTMGDSPAHVVLRQPGRLVLHVHVVPPARFAAALLHATGSPAHVAALARRAADRGLALDERGLRAGERRLRARTEVDLYHHLALCFVPPELREDGSEVEAAADGTLPAHLVQVEDVQGVVHCHTTYSDGKHTVEEMARAAEAMGMRYLTVTDHSPTAGYAGGLTVDRLRRQWDEIARVQDSVGIRLLRGTESDILRDGSLDYPDAVLEQLDVVIASIHNRYGMNADDMTNRLVRAMRHPLFKVWGHGLGRYLLSRPALSCHMDEVLDAVAESRAAIEVNGDPRRLDLEPRWIREARRRGIRFVVSTDAHSVRALENLRWGVDMARRGWLQPADVLNTGNPETFADIVRPSS